MRTYSDFQPTFEDRATWTVAHVLRERARTHGDKVWIEVPSTSEQYTFAETLARATEVASGLLANGHNPGDRVVVMMPNCSDYLFAWLGSALAGMVEVPINTAYRGSFFEHQVSTVSPSAAVVDVGMIDRLVEGREACRSLDRVYLVSTGHPDDAASAIASASEVLSAAGYVVEPFSALIGSAVVELPELAPTDLGAVFFTSGTTGLSKGVMMPHAHVYFFADECVSLTRLTDDDTYLSMGPLFHGNSQFLAAYPALIAGARYVMRERFSASKWASWVRESRATVTNFVGVMMDFVWQQPVRPDDADNNLRCIFAAPTASYAGEFADRFGIEAFVEVFGLTETAMPIMTPYGADRPLGSAGLAVADWFDIRLVDPNTDEEVPTGEVGELVVRPKAPFTTCAGYFAMAEESMKAFRNLWFHTGDGLRQDEEGWYYFVDRLKDAIRRRGENISSYEIEQALIECDGIAECAAIGVPSDHDAGEDEVMVFVVPDPAGSVDAEKLWEFADRRLPGFAVPRYVAFVDGLPRTPSEKVQKVKLRELGPSIAVDRQERLTSGSGA